MATQSLISIIMIMIMMMIMIIIIIIIYFLGGKYKWILTLINEQYLSITFVVDHLVISWMSLVKTSLPGNILMCFQGNSFYVAKFEVAVKTTHAYSWEITLLKLHCWKSDSQTSVKRNSGKCVVIFLPPVPSTRIQPTTNGGGGVVGRKWSRNIRLDKVWLPDP
jgi:hypothetical protein